MKTHRPSPLSKTLALVPPTIALVAQHASGAFDAFIKIGDIKGESVDSKHAEWIELNNVQWGVGRTISSASAGNRNVSAPSITELTLTKPMDRSSPPLFLNAVGGSGAIPTVTLELVNTVSTYRPVFYRLTLSDVLVSTQTTSGDTAAGNRPTETVSLNFTKIKIEYYMLDAKGSPIAVPAVGFDLTTGKSF